MNPSDPCLIPQSLLVSRSLLFFVRVVFLVVREAIAFFQVSLWISCHFDHTIHSVSWSHLVSWNILVPQTRWRCCCLCISCISCISRIWQLNWENNAVISSSSLLDWIVQIRHRLCHWKMLCRSVWTKHAFRSICSSNLEIVHQIILPWLAQVME